METEDSLRELPESKNRKQSPGEINFRPLTEGLGFQPFSDGMPYAPIQKSSAQSLNPQGRIPSPFLGSGTGAVAAGPPTLAKSLPVIGPSTRTPGVRSGQTPAASSSSVMSPSAPDPIQSATTSASVVHEEWKPGFLYLFQRVMAYVLDQLIIGILFLGAISAMISYHLIGSELVLNEEALILGGVSFFVLSWVLITFQEVVLGSSIGKRMFRLGFDRSPFRILVRAILFVPCTLLVGIGLLWSLFNSQRCCLHDRLSGIQPIDL
jgi:hypothetical protein